MPIYEFKCKQCDTRFDKLVRSMKDPEAAHCPKCGSKKTERSLSLFAVGSEQAGKSAPSAGGCGRCGGPGPCGLS